MFRELVELGERLKTKEDFPAAGFYQYGEPIRWIVHVTPDEVYIEESELALPRPFDGRTSAIRAHPLADEAAYALGVSRKKTGEDKKASAKHETFRALLAKLRSRIEEADARLAAAIALVEQVLENGMAEKSPRYPDILSKDWVSFVPDAGPLQGQHLFTHPAVQRFWIEELEERSRPGNRDDALVGECAVCGRTTPLVGKVPKVKLASTVPLHGLNADAFVSHIGGSSVFEGSHLGICFRCGETSARAFNYLTGDDTHHKALFWDKNKRDSLANQHAVYWLRNPATMTVGETVLDPDALLARNPATMAVGETVLDPDALLAGLTEPIAESRTSKDRPVATPTLPQLARLIDLPWKPKQEGLDLDRMGFYLAVLSPNVGRIALRDWYDTSLAELRKNLSRFLAATAMVTPWGDAVRPISISSMIRATGTANPNLTRQLLRTGYLGHSPPLGLITAAVRRLRVPATLQDPEHRWESHALIAGIKLCLFYGKKEVHDMDRMNDTSASKPYLCGRLLAIFETAQQRASGGNLNTTLVDRYYGSMSTAPGLVLGTLSKQANVAHLPKLRKERRGTYEYLMTLLEDVSVRLGRPEDLAPTFSLREQGEFALGFYQQRAELRRPREEESGQESQKGDEE